MIGYHVFRSGIRVLSLNINGGKEIIDNSLSEYVDEIDADT